VKELMKGDASGRVQR